MEYKNSSKCLVPIGRKCDVANILRKAHLRKMAFPFDWNVVTISTALQLIENRFKDFLLKENLIFLPPIKGRPLNEKNELIRDNQGNYLWAERTPCICKKYNMLFTHDFSEKGIEELPIIQEKYARRISRLLSKIDEGEDILFVYDDREIYEDQYPLFEKAGINIRELLLNDNFHNMKNNFHLPIENVFSYLNSLPSFFTIQQK